MLADAADGCMIAEDGWLQPLLPVCDEEETEVRWRAMGADRMLLGEGGGSGWLLIMTS